MKLFRLFVVIVLGCACVISLCCRGKKQNKDFLIEKKIELTDIFILKEEIYIGKTLKDSDLAVSFMLVNKGETPLVIKKVISDCKCTYSSWDNKPVIKNDTTLIKIKYDTSIPGFFFQKVTVYTNTIDSPHLLSFKGEIIDNN